MAVNLPSGWKNFQGGGSDPDLCGEPQDCEEPPCGEVPPLGLHKSGNFDCTAEALISTVSVTGGVPPFTWSTTNGLITVTDLRTITLAIGSAIDRSRAIVVGGFPNCIGNFFAYIDRGVGIYSVDGFVGSCAQATCALVFYNCFDELVRIDDFAGNYNIGSEDDPGNFCKVWDDIEAPGPTSFMGTHPGIIDYSKCGHWPSSYGGYLCSVNPNTLSNPLDPACDRGGCGWPATEADNPQVSTYSGDCETPALTDGYTPPQDGPQDLSYYIASRPNSQINRCDVRHADLLAQGCSPCKLLAGVEIVVTVTDATGQSTTIVIPVS